MPSKSKQFDPLAYIESAFLDTRPAKTLTQPKNGAVPKDTKTKFRRTEMRAPRPRRTKESSPASPAMDPALRQAWEALPRTMAFLSTYFDDSVAAKYYGDFGESRQELIKRILDPQLSLEETSRLLGVCPATIRRYTNRGWLKHHRTNGGQRRFRLSDIGSFVEEHGRFPKDSEG